MPIRGPNPTPFDREANVAYGSKCEELTLSKTSPLCPRKADLGSTCEYEYKKVALHWPGGPPEVTRGSEQSGFSHS